MNNPDFFLNVEYGVWVLENSHKLFTYHTTRILRSLNHMIIIPSAHQWVAAARD